MKIKDLKERLDVFFVDINFFFLKKKWGNCLLCIGGVDKDELYRKIKGDV